MKAAFTRVCLLIALLFLAAAICLHFEDRLIFDHESYCGRK